MAFSRPNMCAKCRNHENRRFLVKCHLLKKLHFPCLLCSVHIVTNTTEFSYNNNGILKKLHFLDLACAQNFTKIHFMTNLIPQFFFSNQSKTKLSTKTQIQTTKTNTNNTETKTTKTKTKTLRPRPRPPRPRPRNQQETT